MTDINELTYQHDIVRQEMPNFQSRKRVTIDSGAALLKGTILGVTEATATPAAFSGNTSGSGTIASVAVAAGAKLGVYKVVIMEPGSNAGKFTVEDPDGVVIGTGTVAVEFVGGGLTFTVSDATDFVSGDGFTITVTAAKWGKATYAAAALSNVDAAILLEDADASGGDVANVQVLHRDAQVDITSLIYDSSADDSTKKAALRARLEKQGIQFLAAA
jgi:hypothetical protein